MTVALLIRWEMTASLAQLGAGFIQPFAGGTAMAGRAAKGKSPCAGQEPMQDTTQQESLRGAKPSPGRSGG